MLTHYDFDISGYGWRAYDIAAVALFVVLRQLWLFGLCFNESELVGGADFDEGFIDSKMEYFRKVVF